MNDSDLEIYSHKQSVITPGSYAEGIHMQVQDQEGEVNIALSGFRPDPEELGVILVEAEVEDLTTGFAQSYSARVKGKIAVGKHFVLEHPKASGAATAIVSGIVAVGSLWVRRRHKNIK